MATGRQIQLTKQVGEYLVAAELSRRGLLTTTFAGNVPAYDIVATGGRGQTALVQVKRRSPDPPVRHPDICGRALHGRSADDGATDDPASW